MVPLVRNHTGPGAPSFWRSPNCGLPCPGRLSVSRTSALDPGSGTSWMAAYARRRTMEGRRRPRRRWLGRLESKGRRRAREACAEAQRMSVYGRRTQRTQRARVTAIACRRRDRDQRDWDPGGDANVLLRVTAQGWWPSSAFKGSGGPSRLRRVPRIDGPSPPRRGGIASRWEAGPLPSRLHWPGPPVAYHRVVPACPSP